MARALKVFSTPAGFVTAVVAAPSQKAALEAWGVRENLFASGAAKVVDDPELIARALATPGEIVRVPISSDADMLAAAKPPAGARKAPAGASTAKATASAPASRPARPPPKPPPDRGPLTRAESDLAAAQEAREQALSAIAEDRHALDRREAAARKEATRKWSRPHGRFRPRVRPSRLRAAAEQASLYARRRAT